MSTRPHRIIVAGIPVEIDRKPVKNLHLGVYPPDGRVRVAAPPAVSDDAVRLAVVARLAWVKRQRARFAAQSRQSEREMVSGESHFFEGRRYRLRVIFHDKPAALAVRNKATLELRVRPATTAAARRAALGRWYRRHLRAAVPPLIAKWEAALGVRVAGWGIRRMKTHWGTCNPSAGRVWLNLELAKKPPRCLEYVVVHEMAHLLQRRHNDHFHGLLDRHLAGWRAVRDELNATPLLHDSWRT